MLIRIISYCLETFITDSMIVDKTRRSAKTFEETKMHLKIMMKLGRGILQIQFHKHLVVDRIYCNSPKRNI